VTRWAWRLLRREWRQQLLILAMVTVAVAATFIGSTVATNAPTPTEATFGAADDVATLSPKGGHDVAAQVDALTRRFGRTDVIENQTLAVPGSLSTYSLRAQDPNGPYGRPMLSLVTGRYPSGSGEVALTSGVADALHLQVGATWQADGSSRRVVGIVSNPQDLLDQFALVAPGQVTAPTQVVVLFDAPGAGPDQLGSNVLTRAAAANANQINPMTISVAAATLGMLLVALVSVAGFTVLAQRRLRAIGMLGAQGATSANVGLVIGVNGAATGVVGAVAGFALGLIGWLAYRPRAEASAHHAIGEFQLPWTVIFAAMVLGILATTLGALRPALAIARVPVTAALAAQPPAPRPARTWAGPAGVGLLALAFFLIGAASQQATSAAGRTGDGSSALLMLVLGLVVLCVGVVLVAPSCLALLARLGRRAPIVLRLAMRDLARYRARSGAALAAISLSILIAVIVCVIAAARFGNAFDYVGPNLAANQLIVYTPDGATGQLGQLPESQPSTKAQLVAMPDQARAIATALGSRDVVELDGVDATLQHAASGRSWYGAVYVATPQLLHAFGITQAQVDPAADVLTMRPGLASASRMQLLYGASKFGPGPDGTSWPCPPASCLANPHIQQIDSLPSGTSAPNTVITENAVQRFHLTTTTAGWLIETPQPLTAGQLNAAQTTAAAAGLDVESRNDIPTSAQILDTATILSILLALGILAMSVGLLRSETAGDVRILTATGAGSAARRGVSAATAGSLALIGALVGAAAGYLAAIGFFRTNQLDTLSALTSIPVGNLLLILVGMPLVAVLGGWLLAGREPDAIGRRPLE
jgi:putative ABC transport system permease protein